MKKLLAILLIAVLVLGLVACAGETAPTPAPEPADTPAPADTPPAQEEPGDEEQSNLEISLAMAEEASAILSTDGQVLMPPLLEIAIPERPADPAALDDYDILRWFDMEFVGWDAYDKINPAVSPGDGSNGKHIILIVHGDHPWTTAYMNGAEIAAAAHGMTIDIWSPNWDVNIQNQLVNKAINARPDAIGLIPLNAEAAVMQFRSINEAGIPVFGTNTLPTSESMRYMVTWTGPNDWYQMRLLARALADEMGGQGGIAYLTHNPGGSPFFARMWGPRTELGLYAPDIVTLDVQSPGFDAPAARQVVADWITRFGDDLTAIFLADDSSQAIGAVDAVREAGREDILIVGAGNSRQGMGFVEDGSMLAVNYQTAEGDGAAVIRAMALWFNGQTLPVVGYLTTDLIFQNNVQGFMPAQW